MKCEDCKWWRDHLPKREVKAIEPVKGWWIFPPSIHSVLNHSHKTAIHFINENWNNTGNCHYTSRPVETKPRDFCAKFEDVI